MKTYNQFLETPFSEEVKPPEPQEEDPGIKSKEKRQMQIKKQVLLKKMQAVRAGAGADIVASHTPEGEMVEAKVDDRKEVFSDNKSKARDNRSGYFTGANKLRRTKHWRNRGVKTKGTPESDAKKKAKRDPGGHGPTGLGEEKDAYKYVVSQLKKKYGDGVLTKGDKMPEPSAAQKKKNAAIRAKRAKEDHRDPTEKASDGRYSDRHSNRGSD